MPNGRHGDHPLSDLLNHGSSGFGEEVDRLVLELIVSDRSPETLQEVEAILWQYWPLIYGADKGALVSQALSRLKGLKEQIQPGLEQRSRVSSTKPS